MYLLKNNIILAIPSFCAFWFIISRLEDMMCVIPHTMMVRLLRIKKNKIKKKLKWSKKIQKKSKSIILLYFITNK